MSPWHLDHDLLTRYADDALDLSTSASVEAHLLRCGSCRADFAGQAAIPDLDAGWLDVVDRLDAPRPTLVERLLRRLRVRESEARLLAATPALTVSWLMALVGVLAFAVVAAHTGDGAGGLFLLLAPLLPLAGVATAYGPGVDPAYDVGAAAPYSGARLLLLRSLTVLAASGALVLPAAFLLPTTGWSPLAWLLPSLGLAMTALLLSTRFEPLPAGVAVALAWALLGAGIDREGHLLALVGASAQLAFLVLALVAGALVVTRRSLLDVRSTA